MRWLALGASTGGPPVLQEILARLAPSLPVPVLAVQHIADGFLPGMVDWLTKRTGLPVHIGTHREQPLPGHVYFAPDGYHMEVDAQGLLILNPGPPEGGHRPSVAALFRTLAAHDPKGTIAVLLTGMGKDGAAELKRLRDEGALTICQDRASSVVFGMPGAAVALGAALHELDPEGIADLLEGLLRKTARTRLIFVASGV